MRNPDRSKRFANIFAMASIYEHKLRFERFINDLGRVHVCISQLATIRHFDIMLKSEFTIHTMTTEMNYVGVLSTKAKCIVCCDNRMKTNIHFLGIVVVVDLGGCDLFQTLTLLSQVQILKSISLCFV